MSSESSNLYKPVKVGRVTLEQRIALAPLTRYRADADHVPLPFVKEYYAQRGSVPGTFLTTEATFIAAKAGGYTHVPGLWSKDQIAAWKEVTDAVHAKKSFIFAQLWALGRAAEAEVLESEGVGAVKSASDIPFEGGSKPEPLVEEEILEYVELYRQAALNAIEAGFDGVEIHNANGYLLDQFLQDVSNKRTDKWGGSIENRARFSLLVAKSVVDAVGADRVGLRLSPYSLFQGMKMENPVPQFTYLINELNKMKLAYLSLVTPRVAGSSDVEHKVVDDISELVHLWDPVRPVFVAGGFKPETAMKAVDEDYKDRNVVVLFGRYFVSNPDLVYRIKHHISLVPYERALFYNKTETKGYTTYPFSKEFAAENGLTVA